MCSCRGCAAPPLRGYLHSVCAQLATLFPTDHHPSTSLPSSQAGQSDEARNQLASAQARVKELAQEAASARSDAAAAASAAAELSQLKASTEEQSALLATTTAELAALKVRVQSLRYMMYTACTHAHAPAVSLTPPFTPTRRSHALLAALQLRATHLEGGKASAEIAAAEARARAEAAAESSGLGDEERVLIQEAAKKKIKELKKEMKDLKAQSAEEIASAVAQAKQDAAASLFVSAKEKLAAETAEMSPKQVLKVLKGILREMAGQ